MLQQKRDFLGLLKREALLEILETYNNIFLCHHGSFVSHLVTELSEKVPTKLSWQSVLNECWSSMKSSNSCIVSRVYWDFAEELDSISMENERPELWDFVQHSRLRIVPSSRVIFSDTVIRSYEDIFGFLFQLFFAKQRFTQKYSVLSEHSKKDTGKVEMIRNWLYKWSSYADIVTRSQRDLFESTLAEMIVLSHSSDENTEFITELCREVESMLQNIVKMLFLLESQKPVYKLMCGILRVINEFSLLDSFEKERHDELLERMDLLKRILGSIQLLESTTKEFFVHLEKLA
ncbi:hypothetical protein MP638_004086 [Amoeboaphelidium occidentale]|nr:hypothetical protein MP638_004086 [Amoeboaphelidium occidentale]